MSRSALRLAALANAVVPGLAPASVEGLTVQHGDLYEFAFVTDTQDRAWVVKAGRTEVAGALLEDAIALTALLARRLDILVPVVRAVAVLPRGRAVVYPRLPGGAVDFATLAPGPGLAAEVGRALAHVHNIELPVFEEAGRPSYDAETHRKRTLSELDRASASGHVPAGLLSRWERQLEDVSLWRFAPTPVHGHFVGGSVLAGQATEDAPGGRVLGLLGWEESRVADPADDFADLLVRARDDAVDTVLEAYVQSRIERPDGNLLARARLAAQLSHMHQLLRALATGDAAHIERHSVHLRELDEQLRSEDEHRAEDERRRLLEREAERDRQRLATSHRTAAGPDPGATQPVASPTTGETTQGVPIEVVRTESHWAGSVSDLATQPISDADHPGPEAADHSGATGDATPSWPGSDADDAAQERDHDPEASPDAVDDRHEGASEFVPVETRPWRPETDSPTS